MRCIQACTTIPAWRTVSFAQSNGGASPSPASSGDFQTVESGTRGISKSELNLLNSPAGNVSSPSSATTAAGNLTRSPNAAQANPSKERREGIFTTPSSSTFTHPSKRSRDSARVAAT
jgi:hypothetical protein